MKFFVQIQIMRKSKRFVLAEPEITKIIFQNKLSNSPNVFKLNLLDFFPILFIIFAMTYFEVLNIFS